MAIEEKQLTSFAEMQQKALEVERLEAALKLLKSELKNWVDLNGPLQAGDKVWEYSTSVSWNFSADQLKELSKIIVLDGENHWNYLSFPAASLKKLKWDETFLSHYGERKESRKFSAKIAR